MYDRVSRNPGRVLITPEDGSGAFYATLALADNPTVVGTPLNAANLLSQATASLYGLLSNATPDDAFVKAKSMIDNAQNTANNANTNADGRMKVVSGSYVGTGEYGPEAPNSLVIGADPKAVFISPKNTTNGVGMYPWVLGAGLFYAASNNTLSYCSVVSTNPFIFYSALSSPSWQFNVSGYTYQWVALV